MANCEFRNAFRLSTTLSRLSLAVGSPVSDEQREGEWIVYSDLFDEASEALIERNYRRVEREADALLASAGLPAMDHDSPKFGRLCRRLLETKQDFLRIAADRVDGNYNTGPTCLNAAHRNGHPPGVQGPAAASHAMTSPIPLGPMFSEAVYMYFKENVRSERTDAQIRAELDRFLEHI